MNKQDSMCPYCDDHFLKGFKEGFDRATAQVIKDVKEGVLTISHKGNIEIMDLLKWLESYSKDTFGTTKLSIKDKGVEK